MKTVNKLQCLELHEMLAIVVKDPFNREIIVAEGLQENDPVGGIFTKGQIEIWPVSKFGLKGEPKCLGTK